MEHLNRWLDWTDTLQPEWVGFAMSLLIFIAITAVTFAVLIAIIVVFLAVPLLKWLLLVALGAGVITLFWHVVYNQE